MTKELLEAANKIVGRIIQAGKEIVSRSFILEVKGNRKFLLEFEQGLRKFVSGWTKDRDDASIKTLRKPKETDDKKESRRTPPEV